MNEVWLERLSRFKQLVLAYSGGLDSSVLLHLIASNPVLRAKLLVVHVNHKISDNADLWQEHCASQCQQWDLPFVTQAVVFDRTSNIEEGARLARYEVFASLLSDTDCLLLAHHQDDQAETVLLQLFRGAGIDGMAAMKEFSSFAAANLARPLLNFSRKQLEQYAHLHGLQWIEDESNTSTVYSRNFIRHELMPLVTQKWPGITNTLARSASHCQQAQSNLQALAMIDCVRHPERSAELSLTSLQALSADRISNVLRFWLKQNKVQAPSTSTFERIIEEVITASPDATPLVSWADVQIRRYRNTLYLDRVEELIVPERISWHNFPKPLALGDAPWILSAAQTNEGINIPQNAQVEIRFRIGGEEFNWHGQTKKLKKLSQEWGIPPWLRDKIPLLYLNNTLAAVIGYAISDDFYSNTSGWVVSQQKSLDLTLR